MECYVFIKNDDTDHLLIESVPRIYIAKKGKLQTSVLNDLEEPTPKY